MKVEKYSFGRISINGKAYISDVIIYPGKVDSSWWRREGHCLHLEDLAKVIDERPELIVIGTGFYGVMQVSGTLIRELTAKGIEVHVATTADAIKFYNDISERKRAIACLHVTC